MAEKDSGEKPYDILIMGKTGYGKSTAGNILLDNPYASVNRIVDVLYKLRSPVGRMAESPLTAFGEAAAGDKYSCTTRPDVLYNPDTNIRVFDTKGFADSNLTPGLSSFANNLGVMRSILTWQSATGMSFRRVLYFLPNRGPLEKIDGNLQEEIEIMLHFFGPGVFNCMVLVFTVSPKRKNVTSLDDEYGRESWEMETQDVMLEAIRRTAKRLEVHLPKDFKCPPVVFIPKAGPSVEVITSIKQAKVLIDEPYSLAFRKTICAKCAGHLKFPYRRDIGDNYKEFGTDPITVKYDYNADPIETPQSKCHPGFVTKYSFGQKLGGGLAHIASLGILRLVELLRETDYLPFFRNSEEVCVYCKMSPSEGRGCMKVNTEWKAKNPKYSVIVVKHSSDYNCFT